MQMNIDVLIVSLYQYCRIKKEISMFIESVLCDLLLFVSWYYGIHDCIDIAYTGWQNRYLSGTIYLNWHKVLVVSILFYVTCSMLWIVS